jgi:MFS family permease
VSKVVYNTLKYLKDKSNTMASVTSELSLVPSTTQEKAKKGAAFWLSFLAISVSVFLSALDLSAVATALPTIVADLQGGDNFSWVGSAYALSSTSFLPLSGKAADIFGRKPVMLLSIFLFATGSAISGASQNMSMLIAARSKLTIILLWLVIICLTINDSHSRSWWWRYFEHDINHNFGFGASC